MITIGEFSTIDLRVGRVVHATRVEGSEKLLRLEVDLGENTKRQILAGIAASYDVDVVIGKQIVVVANLEPRMLMGLESQGMVLATGEAGNIVLLMPEREVMVGSRVR